MLPPMPTDKRPITPEDLWNFRLIRECRISPDGTRVLYSLERFDRDKRRAFQNLWIVPTDGSAEPRPFTVGDHRDSAPRWSPDGRRVAFLSNRLDKKTKLFVIPADGGEAEAVTDMDGDYAHPCWSPDGRHIAFELLADDPPDGDTVVAGDDGKPDRVYRHVTRLSYKADGKGWLPRERRHIWVVDLSPLSAGGRGDGGEGARPACRRLTDGPFDHVDPCWSPDGRELVVAANRNERTELNSTRIDLWRVALDGTLTLIPTPAGPKEKPSWSPDGKWIAYIGHDDPDCGWGEKNPQIVIVRPDGAEVRQITRSDVYRGNCTIGDLTGLSEPVPPTWTQRGTAVVFQESAFGATTVVEVPLTADSRRHLTVEGVCGDYSIASADPAGRAAMVISGPGEPSTLRIISTVPYRVAVEPLPPPTVDPNGDFAKLFRIAMTASGSVLTEDATDTVAHWIIGPPDFDPTKKHPAVLAIHGGPRTQYGHTFYHEFQCLAAAGYVVMYTNPRGSQGYGEEHAAAIRDAWGTVDYDDLMAATDYLAALPYVDASRLGVIGGSYGGYMVNWIIGHTDRFAAAVTDRCVSNLVSFFGSSDIGWELRREFFRRWPWQDTAKLWERSPIAYADNFKTPTLIVHSENDDRCPLEQAQQMFTALQARGVPSEMLVFPDESHGMSRGGRPDRRVARLKRILAWFDRFLKH